MIKAPKWCSNAVPVKSGWADPITGEVLKVQNFTESQISEWSSGKSPSLVEESSEDATEEESED